MRTKVIATAGLLVLGLGCGSAAPAIAQGQQQQPAPPAPPADLLFKITQPGAAAAPDSIKRDDLRPIPPGPDPLSGKIRFEAVPVGDPRCYPGEDAWDPAFAPRRSRSRR